jgi:hypothetical protein
MTVGLTTQQIDHICHQIGEWYLNWRDCMINWEQKTHKLGFAKEQLKEMICGVDCGENTSQVKSKVEKLQDIISYLENVSLVLGITHGALAEIVKSPDEELRGKLTDLFHKLSKDVHDLFYAQVEKEIKQ